MAMSTVTSVTPKKFNVYIQVLAWSQQSNSASVPIYCIVYKSGGLDTKVFMMRDLNYSVTSKDVNWLEATAKPATGDPRLDFESDFEFIGPGMTTFDHSGWIMGDCAKHWNDYLHMWWADGTYNTNPAPLYALEPNQYTSGSIQRGLQISTFFYRFWRGTTGYKIRTTGVNGDVLFQITSGSASLTNNIQACHTMSNPNTQVAGQAMIPYFRPTLMESTFTEISNICLVYTSTTASNYGWRTRGDDFRLIFMCLPPVGTYGRNDHGQQQLTAFWATAT
jgi:hypothetical protein